MRAPETEVKVEPVVARRKARRFFFVWLIPLIWLGIAGMSLIHRGGEHMALFVALLPALLVHKIFGVLDGFGGNDFTLPFALGALVMLAAGLLLDFARVRSKTFFISFAA